MMRAKKLFGGLMAVCMTLASVFIYEPTSEIGIGETVSAATYPEGFTVDTTIKDGACYRIKNVKTIFLKKSSPWRSLLVFAAFAPPIFVPDISYLLALK